MLHALDLARRLEGTGVSAFSVYPGWIRSNLVENPLAHDKALAEKLYHVSLELVGLANKDHQ